MQNGSELQLKELTRFILWSLQEPNLQEVIILRSTKESMDERTLDQSKIQQGCEHCNFKNYATRRYQHQQAHLNKMTKNQIELLEVYAVEGGAHVTYSSYYVNGNIHYIHYPLNYINCSGYYCWSPVTSIKGQWIQVSLQQPKFWTKVYLQGCGNDSSWVTSLKICYTTNGKSWETLRDNQGKAIIFSGSNDSNTRQLIEFKQPIYAKAIRIYPETWYSRISIRFQAIYLDLQPF